MQVEDGIFEGLEERASAAGMEVSDLVSQVVTREDQRRRFLEYAKYYTDLFMPVFAEEFGYSTTETARGTKAA